MNHLQTIDDTLIFADTPSFTTDNFKTRHAARAVLRNNRGEVALLKVKAYNYHKLPGGGVEEGEDMRAALARELLEETGCSAEILAEIGEIIEYRNQWQMKQISHCYLAEQTGMLQGPTFTQKELEEGFELLWAKDIPTALTILENDTPANYDGLFIQRRDSLLLDAALKLIGQTA